MSEPILGVLHRAVSGAMSLSRGFGPKWLAKEPAGLACAATPEAGGELRAFGMQGKASAYIADNGWQLTRAGSMSSSGGTAGRFYKTLLAMAGHDLRHPLQVIVSANSLLSRRLSGTAEREYLARSRDASFQLSQQLDKLVEALKLHDRAEKINCDPVALKALFAELARENADLASSSEISLRFVESNATVMSDSFLLQGIIRNLIRNAIKYNRTGGRVLVGCRRMDGAIRIEVRDNGIGISRESLFDIFEAFKRLDPAAGQGLGLGLFIVRHAADALGHKIDVSSHPGKGSCFSIEIPAAA
jgi:two-component system, OmpR family, phosphate regulon sensor histidine kinase PhoR